jgi:hypothetical protein
MIQRHPEGDIYRFIVGDFRTAWNAVAADDNSGFRCNFLFARQAMNLLEWAARLCASDPKGNALRDLSREIRRIEFRYFTRLPGDCAGDGSGYVLPYSGADRRKQLLWALFDLIRHGQSHEYQDTIVDLNDTRRFCCMILGVRNGLTLDKVRTKRKRRHLSFCTDPDGDVTLTVCPGLLFLDIQLAIKRAGLLKKGLTVTHLTRPKHSGSPNWQFSSQDLETVLARHHLRHT